jgi:hypothetical protein
MVLLSVLHYQIIVYYNCKPHAQHPREFEQNMGKLSDRLMPLIIELLTLIPLSERMADFLAGVD